MKNYVKPKSSVVDIEEDISKKICECSPCDCPDWPPGRGCGCKSPGHGHKSVNEDETGLNSSNIWEREW